MNVTKAVFLKKRNKNSLIVSKLKVIISQFEVTFVSQF